MNAYIYNADIYCEDCGADLRAELRSKVKRDDRDDSDSWPQGPFADGGGEADCPRHCGHCGCFLENPLTTHGVEYVREAVTSAKGECWEEWSKYYGIVAADDGGE